MTTDIADYLGRYTEQPLPGLAPQNRLILGDCLELMPNMPAESVDLVLTDPPYMVRYQSRDGRRISNDDNDEWLEPAFAEIYRMLKPNSFAISFYGWPLVDRFMRAWRVAGFDIAGHFVFPKRYTSSVRHVRYQHECAYLLAKGAPQEPVYAIGDVIDWTYSGNRLHPTQKPISVLLPIVESFSPAGGLVFDPFAGSGSTLIAARMLGRAYLGIEVDSAYHDIARERLRQSSGGN